MRKGVKKQISRLGKLSKRELLKLWAAVYQTVAPAGMRRELIIPFLAYRIQENAQGGLSAVAQAMLRSALRQLKQAQRPEARTAQPRIKAGTRVIRRWKGEIHEVDVTETAYQYRDHEYRSLSEVARKITGTRWSGPAFFGLRKLQSHQASKRD